MIQPPRNNLDVQILEALVAPEQGTLGKTLANAILSCEFPPEQKAEIEKLLSKNNAGTISARQREKLEAYVRIGNWLSLMKAKARVSLGDQARRR